MRLFDAYVFVDWSAANGLTSLKPKADAIWVGKYVPSQHPTPHTRYCRSRAAAALLIRDLLITYCQKEHFRVLLGFDFPYGYPSGLAAALGLQHLYTARWKAIWCLLRTNITNTINNRNNRFQVASCLNAQMGGKGGPFWGCPGNQATRHLLVKSPQFPFLSSNGVSLSRLRIVEKRIKGVQETWKLYGAGSVGSQALVGIPYVYQLWDDPQLKHFSLVWPFETGFTSTPAPSQGPFVLHGEIWPGIVSNEVNSLIQHNTSLIRDKAQVIAMCQWAASNDANGTLGSFFAAPHGLCPTQLQMCVAEEGWILGV